VGLGTGQNLAPTSSHASEFGSFPQHVACTHGNHGQHPAASDGCSTHDNVHVRRPGELVGRGSQASRSSLRGMRMVLSLSLSASLPLSLDFVMLRGGEGHTRPARHLLDTRDLRYPQKPGRTTGTSNNLYARSLAPCPRHCSSTPLARVVRGEHLRVELVARADSRKGL
jgi:hypothetical protein